MSILRNDRFFSQESLALLRSRIDLVEVLQPYVPLKRTGAIYKGLCPFHEEKTPSFMVQSGAHHYHCFGCHAHGDAIQFLMTHLLLSFAEAVEMLAERFGVALEQANQDQGKDKTPRALLRETLEQACQFYQNALLPSEEPFEYLMKRDLSPEFIQKFRLGFGRSLHSCHIPEHLLRETGLINEQGRELFANRITIPLLDPAGFVIGFSARQYQSQATGPKYINSPETALFKKSQMLFGLYYSRKRIAKEQRVLIVEGQLDALRLIYAGFDWTIAGQGTAFGEERVQELIKLGVRLVYLALDGDAAGKEATIKIGHLFQKEGIGVKIVPVPSGKDPDAILREGGAVSWQSLLDQTIEYLPFYVEHLSHQFDSKTPAGKNELVQTIATQVRTWKHPVLIHETLRELSRLTNTFEWVGATELYRPQLSIQASSNAKTKADPNRMLEIDVLSWLLFASGSHPELRSIAEKNLQPTYFSCIPARALYEKYLTTPIEEGLLRFAIVEDLEQQSLFAELSQKKINRGRALEGFIASVQRMLERRWMEERELIQTKIAQSAPENLWELTKRFGELSQHKPTVKRDG